MTDYLDTLEQKTLKEFIPIRAVMELTYRCNFACPHCYCIESASRKELSTSEVKDIIQQLAASGTLFLTFTGGEVLTRSDFWEIAEYARRLRFALRWFTNGSGWDAELSKKAYNLHPLSVEITLYGSCEEVYEAVTGSGENFFRVLSGIRTLRRRGIHVNLKLLVLKENYGDRPEMIRLCRELGDSYTMSANITPRDDGSSAPLAHAISPSQYRDFLSRYGQPMSPGHRGPDDYLCNTARNTAVISPYGDVYPCAQIRKGVGNLRENDFHSIWDQSPMLEKLRKLRVKDLKECGGCNYLSSCAYCPGISFGESGRFDTRDLTACRWTRLQAELGLVTS